MTAYELLSRLRTLNVGVSVEESRLRVTAPSSGLLTEDLWRELQVHKEEIRNLLLHAKHSKKGNDPITRVERGRDLPLSFAQQRLWFLAQMNGGNDAYQIPLGLHLHGKLDRAALQRALDRIVERHEALHTTFATADGDPVQRIAQVKGIRFHLLEHDLRQHENAQGELQRLATEEAEGGFDLQTGPLVRGRLIQMAEEEHALLITMHHIVSDEWSLGVLVSDLSTLYAAYVRAEEDPLPELPVQYADYAVWQRKWMEGEVLETQAEYWRKNLTGAPPLVSLPSDRPRKARQDGAGATAEFVLEDRLTAGLKELCRRHGTTLYMTILAGWAVLLGRLSDHEDVVIGTPVANRGRLEIAGLIGFFVNTLVLRLDLARRPTVKEMLARVKTQALAAQQHQDIPFEHVVELLQPVRNLSHSPLFQVVFSWQNTPRGEMQLPGLEVKQLHTRAHGAKFDLALALEEAEGRIVGGIEYATALYDRLTVERYFACLERLLEAMVQDETAVIDGLSLLSDEERNQVLYKWNQTLQDHQQEKCLHELFEQQAEMTPELVVMTEQEKGLSYGELNRRANRLAHYLRSLEVRAEVLVAICCEHGTQMSVALLAVWKAGGACVTLDPSCPGERLHSSGAGILLAQTHLKKSLADLPATVKVFDLDDESAWQDQAATDVGHDGLAPGAARLAYVSFTPGSKKQQQGVMMTHGNLVRCLQNPAYLDLYCHNAAEFEIWSALLRGSCVAPVSKNGEDGARQTSLARPLANAPMYVLDGCRQPVPVGVWGYLYIGGEGVGRGYMNHAELTAEEFVPDPFSAGTGTRMYRAGVPAKWRGDGEIEFLRQKSDLEPLSVPLDDVIAQGDGAPQGETEIAVAQIWADVLQIRGIRRHDNFFKLGGRSLLAVQVIVRLRKALGVEVAISDLFAQPVLSAFARGVANAQKSKLLPIIHVPRDERLPLSFAQQRLWFLAQMEGGSQAYHMPLGLRLSGRLDVAALRQALDRIVARHEVLRTVFEMADGQPVQRIVSTEESRFHLLEQDLRQNPDALGELERTKKDEAGEKFDLQAGPLIRGRLVRVAEEEYALLITMHHIVSDAWSMEVLFKELSVLYGTYVKGEEDGLPELAIQYADYAVWQRKWMEGEVLQQQAEYWRKNLEGAPELLELLADRMRPARQVYSGAKLRVQLRKGLAERLKELSARQGTTLYMTLLAGWAVLLGRLAEEQDVVIGTPVANRVRVEIEGLIGFFVNTLAVRVDLSGRPMVAEMLQRVKMQALTAQQHQDIPFEQVVELVQPVRSLAHSPLFQVMFALQSGSEARFELAGLDIESLSTSPLLVSKFDLTLSLQDSGETIEGGLEYSTALFDRQTVERYAGYYERLLEGMIAAGEGQAVDALALLSEAERRQVIYEWNQSEKVLPTGCVHELFEEQAEKTPEAVAIECGEEALSYAELNARSNQLAHYLRRSGVGVETRIGVCMERSVEMAVALLGILKAGGAYVPLDAQNPAAPLAFIIEDAEVGMVVIQSQLRDALLVEAIQFVPLVCVDDDREMIEEESTENIGLAIDNNQLAYVMYTSGATGRVKGVLVTHRNVAGLARGSRCAGLDRGAVVGQVSKLVFAASTFEIWSALLNGRRLAIVGKVAEGAEEELRGELRDLGVSTVYVSTAMYQESVRRGGGTFAGVEQVLFGGEACDRECVRRGVVAEGTGKVVHVYGATETTGMAACGLVNGVEERKGVPIGRAIGNSATYIVDGELEAVGVRVRGDIFVAGSAIARGYEKQAGETAERFVPDPYRGESGARMYRTGDVGRWDRTGEIEFLWRRDYHGELAGKRIELGKIEARLKEHRRVAETAVVVREDGGGEKGLVAYYTLVESWDGAKESGGSNGSEGDLEAEELRTYLKAQLPEYMVPAKYMCLERMPRNGNGKVDRERLPKPEEEAFAARGYEAPEGDLEPVVAKIWAEVLQVERVGRQDNFFELGGRSLLAVQVAARMRQALGVEIGITDLFLRPVLSDFARALEGAQPSRLPAIGRAERTQPIPLSFAQQRLWFLAQMERASGAYHMPFGVLLQGKLDGVALRRALDRIVARHEGLRTSFVMEGGEPRQHIQAVEESCFYLREHDLRQHQDASSELEKLMAEEAAGRFDLEKGPLIRGRLIRMAEEEHAFLITMHHIVSDEWSMAVMIRELQTLYAAFVRGEEDPLPALTIQYADYAVWQRKWMEGEILQEQAEYWKKNLAGASELLEVPADHARPLLREYRGGFVEWVPGKGLTERLKGLSRRQGTTLYMTVLGGWAALLGRLTGNEDVVVGTQVANRGQREVEGVIGFFVNTLALRLDVSRRQKIGAMLAGVKKQVLEGQEHQDIPFEHVVEIVQPIRSLGHSPVFQVSFAWQNAREGQLELPGLQAKPLPATTHMAAKFDMTVAMWEAEEDLTGGLEYATSLYGEATAQRYLGYLQRLLEGMVENEEAMLGSLPLLSAEERDQIVYEWKPTSADDHGERCLHELFEEQVKRAPEAIAVVYEGASLSYGELNRRANQLAHYLRRMGVGPETVVGICLERSPGILVAVFGILKAGGAYVPLDPDYPGSRIGYMLENAKTGVVVTEERLLDHIPESVTRICLDGDWKQLATESDQNPERLATAENLAYIIYTSGSTGNAKGVMIPHCNLVTYALWANGLMFDATVEIVPVVQALSFDGSIKQLLSPLLTGLTIWVLARKDVAEPCSLIKALSVRRHLRFCAVPTLWTVILDAVESGQAELPPDMIAKAFLGGEELTRNVVERSFKFLPRLELWNFYGPTEATGTAATARIRSGGPITIGRAIAGKKIYILDPEWQLTPRGVVGELFIGGAGVGRGYLNQPELTAERFVPDPSVYGSGAHLYKTGDLGKWRVDGNIEFLGRNDFQVKIRGFRMELGEIEARLMQHEGVSNAIVVAREDGGGNKQLVAYYTAAARGQDGDGCAVGAEDLRDYLSQSLPEHMVPAAYVALAAMPFTPNGKLDKKALPDPQAEDYAVGRYEPPQGEIETALARIWSKVLRVEQIGRNDNFFRLGGHSFLTIQVINLLARENIKILSLDLFAHPTIESLAAKIELQGGHTRADLAVCIRKGGGLEAPLFLVHDGLGELVYGPALSSCIDAGIPIYGLPAAPLDQAPMRTMEGMAIRMVRMIREVQPAGPYRLSGWSFGGVLAYEIATQLIGADQVVEFLGLFDSTYLPGTQNWSAPLAEQFDCKNILWELVERWTHNDPAFRNDQTLQAAMARARAAAPDMDLPTLIRTCQEMSITPPAWDYLKTEQIEQILLRIRSYHLGLLAYSAQQIPVITHLFTAEDNSFLPFLGWNAVLPENRIRVIPVKGTHMSMMATPNVEMLGQAMSCAIRKIAGDSRALPEKDYRPMATLQTGQRDTAPLFCLSGAGASVSSFIELVSKLNPTQRVYGFESRGLDGTLLPYSTVSTAAESYLRELQDVYPEGPIHLLGHSFGGWVAFEMANRLIERGRDVACLTILDSEAPREDTGVRELTHIEVTIAFIDLFEELLEHPLGIKQSDLEARSEKAQMELLHHCLVAEGLLPQRSQPDMLCGPLRTFAMAIRSSFNPNRPHPGAVQLVLVDESKLDHAANGRRQEDIVKKWKRWAPNLIYRRAPGNHMTVLKAPHVLELARLVLNPAIVKRGWEQAAGTNS